MTGIEDLQAWVGRKRSIQDEMAAPLVRRMAALTGRAGIDLNRGAAAPAHWLAMLFDDAAPQAALGADGHPTKGDFLPPIPLPRRMLGGRRLRFLREPCIGDALTRETTIASITPKQGRSGALIFVMLRHEISDAQGLIATEEQDIAYREAGGAAASASPAPEKPETAWRKPFRPDSVMLFRYSALGFNGHRIHYDADYARQVEGYPALVVNGGLTTLMLLEAALQQAPGGKLFEADIRTLRPLFCDAKAMLCGAAPDSEGRQMLWVEDEAGAMVFRISARITP